MDSKKKRSSKKAEPEQEQLQGIQKYTNPRAFIECDIPITQADIDAMTPDDRRTLYAAYYDQLDGLEGQNRESAIARMDGLTDPTIGNITFQQNHTKIEGAISALAASWKPVTITAIADQTGLTRRTVYRHLSTIPASKWGRNQANLHKYGLAMIASELLSKALEYAQRDIPQYRHSLNEYLRVTKLLLSYNKPPATSNQQTYNIKILQLLNIMPPDLRQKAAEILAVDAEITKP